jgi:hypothetical protein
VLKKRRMSEAALHLTAQVGVDGEPEVNGSPDRTVELEIRTRDEEGTDKLPKGTDKLPEGTDKLLEGQPVGEPPRDQLHAHIIEGLHGRGDQGP